MELLERFARGDREAFELLFREHQREVFAWCMRIVRERGAAEDLTAEAFWKMYRAHGRFDPARSFGAWARRVATNLALDYLRKTRRETPLEHEPANAANQNPGEQREKRDQIAAAFRRLSPKLQLVATLSLVEDVPHNEIAQSLGIAEATVRVRLFRATKILRKELRKLGAHG
jgi:RNA polymerase sigma factor (sigma-70 family)